MTPDGRPMKQEWEDFVACFERRQIGPLKHFTAVENLKTILLPLHDSQSPAIAPGLYSRSRMSQYRMKPLRLHSWGGKGRQLEDYICLCFTLPGGIIRTEIEQPAVLLIDPIVIAWEGTCFCRTNSASNRISVEEILAYSDLEAFESLFRAGFGDQLKYRQAEILVKDHIPLELIGAIVLPETASGKGMARWLTYQKWRRRLTGKWGFPQIRFGSWQSFA